MGSVPQRTSNRRVTGYIAAVALAATALVVVVVPPLATRWTAPAEPVRRPGAWAAVEARPVPVPVGGPVLPAPGEQPEDVAASRAQVEEALTTVFRGANPRPLRLSRIDDPSNLEAAMEEVRQRYSAASSSAEPVMAELVFTDAANASFLFRLDQAGAPLLPSRIGTARLVDGQWMVTRSTLCDVLRAAGTTCPAPAPPPT